MSHILISSIIRNEARHLDRWYSQIRAVVASQPQHTFSLSVFENDSTDGSGLKAAAYDWSGLGAFYITQAKLNSPFFVGGKDATRVALLANARNRTLYHFPMLAQMDWVLVIEPDVAYTVEVADKLINHEHYYGKRLDVFSGKSSPPGSKGLYDSWGSRKTNALCDWRQGDTEFDGFEPMWSTFNCLTIYRADAIRAGHTFGGVNPRTGLPDCDTAVICENFRAAGYDQIYWDTNLRVEHSAA